MWVARSFTSFADLMKPSHSPELSRRTWSFLKMAAIWNGAPKTMLSSAQSLMASLTQLTVKPLAVLAMTVLDRNGIFTEDKGG